MYTFSKNYHIYPSIDIKRFSKMSLPVLVSELWQVSVL